MKWQDIKFIDIMGWIQDAKSMGVSQIEFIIDYDNDMPQFFVIKEYFDKHFSCCQPEVFEMYGHNINVKLRW